MQLRRRPEPKPEVLQTWWRIISIGDTVLPDDRTVAIDANCIGGPDNLKVGPLLRRPLHVAGMHVRNAIIPSRQEIHRSCARRGRKNIELKLIDAAFGEKNL